MEEKLKNAHYYINPRVTDCCNGATLPYRYKYLYMGKLYPRQD